MLEITDDLKLD